MFTRYVYRQPSTPPHRRCVGLDDGAPFFCARIEEYNDKTYVSVSSSSVSGEKFAQKINLSHDGNYIWMQVMPIARGEGIDQRQLLNYYRRLSAGGWCHIFPGDFASLIATVVHQSEANSHAIGIARSSNGAEREGTGRE